MKGLYIGWGRPNAWGEALGTDLGARVVFTQQAGARRTLWGRAPLRYVSDFLQSIRAIAESRADFLMWQVPPSLAPILLRGGWHRGRVPWGLDLHSGAVNLQKWKWLLPVLRSVARSAAVTVAHNTEIAALIEPWPSPVVVVDNYAVPLGEVPKASERCAHGAVTVVASGSEDEPLDVVLAAARILGAHYQFVVTGSREAVLKRMRGFALPPNVRLTGFLSRPAYLELLASCSMAVCLTDRPATMQLGAWEAVSVGCPVVVSDYQVLRDYFRDVAAFTANSGDALAACVGLVRRDHTSYVTASENMAVAIRDAREHQLRHVRARLVQ